MTTTENLPLIISFYTHKGGVGKTTCIHNITEVLAQEFGLEVLLVDMDPQASLTGVVMHNYFKNEGKRLSQGSKRKTAKQIVESGEEYFYEKREQDLKERGKPVKRHTIYEIFKRPQEGQDNQEAEESDDNLSKEYTDEDSDQEHPSGTQDESNPEGEKDEYNLSYIIENWKQVIEEVEPIRIETSKKGTYFKFIPGDLNITVIEGEITEALAISSVHGKMGSFFMDMPGAICGILREIGKKEKVDVILLDLNPGAGSFNMSCIMGSDYFIVPSLPDFYSRRSIRSLSKLLERWDTTCKKYRSKAKYPCKFPPCPRFLGQIYNQVKILNLDFTKDQEKKIEFLQKEIKERLEKYFAKGAAFLEDPPVITDFTRLRDKVEEVGIPISRADYEQIPKNLIKKNITKEEVSREAKLHLNCYFAAVVHIFSNLSPQHHKLLNNVLKLDIDRIFPSLPDNYFSNGDKSFEDIDGETWERQNSNLPPAYDQNAIVESLNQTNFKLYDDVFNAFSLLKKQQEEEEEELVATIEESSDIQERLNCFKKIQEKFQICRRNLLEKMEELKKTNKVFGLVWKDIPNDPQLCKISYCSIDREEKGSKKLPSPLNKKRAKLIDSYIDDYVKIRSAINEMNKFLIDEQTRKVYFELIQIDTAFLGERSLLNYAKNQRLSLKIWKKEPDTNLIKAVHSTSKQKNEDYFNLLCETSQHFKIYTEIKKRDEIEDEAEDDIEDDRRKSSRRKSRPQQPINKGKSAKKASKGDVKSKEGAIKKSSGVAESKSKTKKESNAKKSSTTQNQKPQETINQNGKRTRPPKEKGMETKKKHKS